MTLEVNKDFIASGSKEDGTKAGRIVIHDRVTLEKLSVMESHEGSIVRVMLSTKDDGSTLLISWGEEKKHFGL